jgi:hypothetical protein
MENLPEVKERIEVSMADIKKYIAPNATDKELFMFMGIAKSYGLNPLKREIHFVKYGSAPASIIVGYEIYLKRAERTGKLDGWKCWIEGDKAVIEIKRKDQSIPIKWEVDRKEFDKQQSTWKAMPNFMLKKVAIAQGFRLAFPDELGGLPYLAEELPQTAKMTSEELAKDEIIIDAQPEATTAHIEEVPPQANVESHEANVEAPKQSTDAKPNMITEAQRKRFYAIAKGSGKSDAEIKSFLQANIGSESTGDIQKGVYEYLCNEVGKQAAA